MADVDPAGPAFISHRHSDGQSLAWRIARDLRSSGIPVWLDSDDLPPGDTNDRLVEALARGLSAGVLVVTPEVTASSIVLDLEAPRLAALSADPMFTFAVVNEIATPDGDVDRSAPTQITNLPLDGVLQYSTLDERRSPSDLGRALARARLAKIRAGRSNPQLRVAVQTRRAASAYASSADLVFRTVPPTPGSRVLADDVWEDLERLLAWLPDVVAETGALEVLFTGGGHLSVACTIGAALPTPSGIRIAAVDTRDDTWRLHVRGMHLRARLGLIRRPLRCEPVAVPVQGSGAIAVAVDLHPTPPPADTFLEYLTSAPGRFTAAYRISRRTWLNAEDGPVVVAQVSEQIRAIAARHQALNIHLFLRTPWVAALLLGASMNTLLVTLYEWDNAPGSPAVYIPTRTVASGLGGGPLAYRP